MLRWRNQQGDTLIEVLFAIAIFSAVAVGSVVIMNQGIASAQTSLEINLVRNQIDTQAELLRHMNDAKLTSIGRHGSFFTQRWDDAVRYAVNGGAQDYDAISSFDDCKPEKLPAHAFFVDPKSGQIVEASTTTYNQPSTFAQIQLSDTPGVASVSDMIWIQAVTPATDTTLENTKSYDFHIRACWQSPGDSNVMKLGTIVRLYAPSN